MEKLLVLGGTRKFEKSRENLSDTRQGREQNFPYAADEHLFA